MNAPLTITGSGPIFLQGDGLTVLAFDTRDPAQRAFLRSAFARTDEERRRDRRTFVSSELSALCGAYGLDHAIHHTVPDDAPPAVKAARDELAAELADLRGPK